MTNTELADLMAYDDMCARIYADKRLPPGTRELALALAWVNLRDPDRSHATGSLGRTGRLLGRDNVGRCRHKLLFAEDAPCYDEDAGRMWFSGSCEGPRLRPYKPRDRPALRDPGPTCGAHATIRVPEYDMTTGQLREEHWFCRRHSEHADRVRAQIEAVGEPPEPIPNVGGLLGTYFKPEPLIKVYFWARPNWTVPYHGICADDWPVPGRTAIPRKPRLGLVVG